MLQAYLKQQQKRQPLGQGNSVPRNLTRNDIRSFHLLPARQSAWQSVVERKTHQFFFANTDRNTGGTKTGTVVPPARHQPHQGMERIEQSVCFILHLWIQDVSRVFLFINSYFYTEKSSTQKSFLSSGKSLATVILRKLLLLLTTAPWLARNQPIVRNEQIGKLGK